MIGTKPAAATRFGSSNIADPTVNACDDCTGNAVGSQIACHLAIL
jgi:hypothetical protein